jgi:hypothetical protein
MACFFQVLSEDLAVLTLQFTGHFALRQMFFRRTLIDLTFFLLTLSLMKFIIY